MLKQIRSLSRIQLCNLLGLNEIRHTKDKSRRARYLGLALAWLVVGGMMCAYIVMLSLGLTEMGMGEIVPVYLSAICSLAILIFTFFKAGSVIFPVHSYEILVSLPVSQTAIVISRFLTMYVSNLLLCLLIMIPGMAVYALKLHPSLGFYLYGILGMILLPLLPLTLATAAGAGITAVTSRMKHKSLAASGLMILLMICVLAVSMRWSGEQGEITKEILINFADVMKEKVGQIYPPSIWFGEGVTSGNTGAFLLFAGVSAGAFLVLVLVLQHWFLPICTALHAVVRKNDYQMGRLRAGSVTAALWKKEIKRYLASTIYLSNTVVGYLLMVLASAALLLAGPEKLEAMLAFPGLVSGMLPLLLAMTASIMPVTACAVSMEGKQWWILQSLPVRGKEIWDGKILLNLTVALPCWAAAVILSFLALHPSPAEGFWIAIIPLVYILFTSVLGIAVNLAMPIFDWESDVRVVKQSASTMVTMLIGMVSAVAPALILFFAGMEYRTVVYGAVTAVILAAAGVIYGMICRKDTCSV
ncbi:MAG: hypothetical protein ACI4WY_01810 [Anaerovoracaceae bacterium]